MINNISHNGINANLSKTDGKSLKEASIEFEAIFVKQILEKMIPSDPLLKGAGSSIYRSMWLNSLSELMAKDGNFGIAKMIVKSLNATENKGGDLNTNDKNNKSKIDKLMLTAALKQGLPINLIKAVGKVESNFNQKAVSRAGAIGIMQLMPATAKEMGSNPNILEDNIKGGAEYLKKMLDEFGNTKMALAAYNSGPSAVKSYKGIPPYKETQNYVHKVLKYKKIYDAKEFSKKSDIVNTDKLI